MNKFFKYGLCGILFFIAGASLSGCNNGGASTESSVEKFTVSFDTQGGSAVDSQKIESGKYAQRPTDPIKDNYSFIGWFKESSGENVFEFESEAIVKDTTVYAGWLDNSSSDVTRADFYWNYSNAPSEVYKSVAFKDGDRISKPADPKREGYEFAGWFTSTDYVTEYSKTIKYEGNQSFYAKWLKIYTMEAENTQLTGIEWSIELDDLVTQSGDKKGSNFSGNVSGKNLIRADENSSGGKFVWGCMNLEEGYLDFEFTADKADTKAQLNIILSAEFWGFKLTPQTFKVLVNPTSNSVPSVNYKDIDLTFVETSTSSVAHPKWVNAYINTISIKEGKNLIRLLVNNSNANSVGTIKAQGPIVDCITVKSTSDLVMTTYSN